MAILYKTDVEHLNGGVNFISKKRRLPLSDVYNAELMLNNEIIPCVVTVFKVGSSYRIDIINDKEKENYIYTYFLEYLKKKPIYLFEYVFKSLLRNGTFAIIILYFMYFVVTLFFIKIGYQVIEPIGLLKKVLLVLILLILHFVSEIV